MARPKSLPDDGYAKLFNWYLNSGAMAKVGHSAWKVLCAVLIHCMDKGQCSPSIDTLHKETGVSPRGVVDARKELADAGLIRFQAVNGAGTTYWPIRDQTYATIAEVEHDLCNHCTGATIAEVPVQPVHRFDPEPMQPLHTKKTLKTKAKTPIVGSLLGDQTPDAEPDKPKELTPGQQLYEWFYQQLGVPCSKSCVRAEVTACNGLVEQYGMEQAQAGCLAMIASEYALKKSLRAFASNAAGWIAKAKVAPKPKGGNGSNSASSSEWAALEKMAAETTTRRTSDVP